jgi:hypothetical protein
MEMCLDQRDVLRATVRRMQADRRYGLVKIHTHAFREVGMEEPSGAWRADSKAKWRIAGCWAGLNPSKTSDSSPRAGLCRARGMILGDQAGCLLRGVFAVGEDGWDTFRVVVCDRGTHGGGLPFLDVVIIHKDGTVGASGEAHGLCVV